VLQKEDNHYIGNLLIQNLVQTTKKNAEFNPFDFQSRTVKQERAANFLSNAAHVETVKFYQALHPSS